jgi:hypothetical protein
MVISLGLTRQIRRLKAAMPALVRERLDRLGAGVVLGIISPLIVAIAAALPAAAQLQTRVITFAEAQDHGAVFEIIDNPHNCTVRFLPDPVGQASIIVSNDCTNVGGNIGFLIQVRLFSRILLNPPWTVGEVTFPSPTEVARIRVPPTGTRNLWTEIRIFMRAGMTSQTAVVLKAVRSVPIAVCPRGTGVFVCATNADCGTGRSCDRTCHTCLAPTSQPLTSRVITVGEIRNSGYDPIRVIWEDFSRNNPSRRCPTSFDNGRTASESGAAVLNCSASTRWSGARAAFDLFQGVTLNAPWEVESANVASFQVGSSSSATPLTVPIPGSNSLFTRIRFDSAARQQARAAVSISIVPRMTDRLPSCTQTVGQQPLFVCSADEDCPTDPIKSVCSVSCGNRCVRP